jgi:hypothetical protein
MKHIKALAKRKWHLSKVIESLCVLSLPSWDQIDQQTSYPYSEQVPGTRWYHCWKCRWRGVHLSLHCHNSKRKEFPLIFPFRKNPTSPE